MLGRPPVEGGSADSGRARLAIEGGRSRNRGGLRKGVKADRSALAVRRQRTVASTGATVLLIAAQVRQCWQPVAAGILLGAASR
jgi:hypothetical protein